MSAHKLSKLLAWVLTLGGAAGLYASWSMTIEKLHLLENPDYVAPCDVNAFITCTSVMGFPQSAIFGFPNQLIGMVGFAVVLTLGVLGLSQVRFPQWILNGLWAGTFIAIIWVHWLAYHSIFVINLLCPWCMVVWAATIAVFSYLTFDRLSHWLPNNRAAQFVVRWGTLIVAIWCLLFVATILFKFFV